MRTVQCSWVTRQGVHLAVLLARLQAQLLQTKVKASCRRPAGGTAQR